MIFLLSLFLTRFICENSLAKNESNEQADYAKLVDIRIGNVGNGLSCRYTWFS